LWSLLTMVTRRINIEWSKKLCILSSRNNTQLTIHWCRYQQ
jgi:hypothetical protein